MARGDYVGLNINHALAGERAAKYSARAADFFSDYTTGMTLEQIGQKHGITRERVRQIMTKIYGKVAMHGGQSVTAKVTAIHNAKLKDEKSMRLWGCTFAQYKMLREHSGKPTRVYSQQKKNAEYRGIEWKFTLWTWWKSWQDSGKWERRGRTKNDYVMARYLDYGPYSPENVYFITASMNIREINTHIAMKGLVKKRGGPKPKTHCKRGHEFTAANIRTQKSGRVCKECDRANRRARYFLKKQTIQNNEITT